MPRCEATVHEMQDAADALADQITGLIRDFESKYTVWVESGGIVRHVSVQPSPVVKVELRVRVR